MMPHKDNWTSRWMVASMLALPLVGLGIVKTLTGRDLGAGFQLSYLLMAGVVLVAVVQSFRFQGFRSASLIAWPRCWTMGTLAVAVVLVLSAAGLYIAPSGQDLGQAWSRFARQVFQLGIMGCFLFAVATWTRGTSRWRQMAMLLLLGALGQAGYAALQGLHYYHPLAFMSWLETLFTSNPAILSGSEELYLGDAFLPIPRLRGTMCEPLYLGNYLLLVWPWIAFCGLNQRLRRGLLAVVLGLLLLTWSRGAWLGFAAQLVVWGLLAWSQKNGRPTIRWRSVLVWTSLGLLMGFVLGIAMGWDRFFLPVERLAQSFSQRDWSNLTRLYSMQAGWRAFLLSPVVGVGWGQFGWHFPMLVDPMGMQSQFSWPVVNNYPLAILCETGLVGFGVFVTIAGGLVASSWRTLKSTSGWDSENRRRLICALVAMTGVWGQLLTFSQYNLPHIWVSIGLLLAALHAYKAEVSTGTAES